MNANANANATETRRAHRPARLLLGIALLAGAGLAVIAVRDPDLPKRVPGVATAWRRVVGNTAITPTPRPVSQHLRDLVRAYQGSPKILFLGDSITNRWRTDGKKAWDATFAPLGAASLGVGEDRIQNLLARLRSDELGGMAPEAVVLLIGTNNLGRNTPGEIADGISLCLIEILRRFPRCRILLLGILPRGDEGWADEESREVNRVLAQLAGPRVAFLDVGDEFRDAGGRPDRSLLPDGVHLSAAGYARLAAAIRAGLRREP